MTVTNQYTTLTGLGFQRRLSKLFRKDGKAMVVGLDHGLSAGVKQGLHDLGAISSTCINGGADAILLGPKASLWAASSLCQSEHSAFWLRLDRTNAFDLPTPQHLNISAIATVQDALRVNADAAVIWYIRSSGVPEDQDAEHTRHVATIAEQCRESGMPLVVEAFTLGSNVTGAEVVKTVRIAYELGADILKIDYPQDEGVLKEILASVNAPVFLAGGPQTDNFNAFLSKMERAMQLGVKGIVIGRNIWQAADPAQALMQFNSIVHGTSLTRA
ncbi:class I fructose-bisphosphate aldolase [Paenibacillus sp. IITD108]|uniref:class I fructose-bisphosphate aldolase n=1 Tax=Paenibacillus sp. IITD108 TaxID=3116649 RepID=UPI002F421643